MKGKQAIAASALTLMLAMGPGAAWSASGTALGVKPQAQADKDGSSRVLTVGADVFIGVSGPGLLQRNDLRVMHDNPIVFALANPTPEITPEEAGLLKSVTEVTARRG